MGPRLPITTASKVFFAGAALLLLGACASVPVEPETGGPGQKASSAQVLSICEKLARSRDTRLAIGLCEKAHLEDQQNPVPLLLLGDMLQQQGALAQAGRAYGMAIDLDPENVEAHYGLGKVFLARNQFDLAIEQFEVARELNTRDHRLYNALGVVLDNLGDHVAAQAHYKIGLELAPDNHALKKNLMLSRRLDSSVTTPAIGPRHKVVPRPVAPQSAPEAVPSKPAPNSPGRLGHEPLAKAPVELPVQESFEASAVSPVETPAPAPTSMREPAVSKAVVSEKGGMPAASGTSQDQVVDLSEEVPAQVAGLNSQTRFIPLPPKAKPAVPAQFASRMTMREKTDSKPAAAAPTESATAAPATILSSAYDEIPLRSVPSLPERRLSRAAEQGPVILASGFNSEPIAAEALPALKSAPEVIQIAETTPMMLEGAEPNTKPMVGEVTVAEVAILAADKTEDTDTAPAAGSTQPKDEITVGVSVLPAAAADAEPAIVAVAPEQPLLSASLATDSMTSNAGEDHFEGETVSGRLSADADPRPASAADTLPRGTPTTVEAMPVPDPAAAYDVAADFPAATSSVSREQTPAPLALVSHSLLQTASLTSGDAEIANGLGEAEPELAAAISVRELRRVNTPRRRFGREHEEDHETRHFEGEIWDLVDVVNPMQHIPVVATIYRDVTDDEIKPAAKIAGGTLFGGVLGFASSLVDSMIEEASGQDIGETAMAAISRPRGAPENDDLVALNERHEELRLAHARGR